MCFIEISGFEIRESKINDQLGRPHLSTTDFHTVTAVAHQNSYRESAEFPIYNEDVKSNTKIAISLQAFASHEVGVAVFTCLHAKNKDSRLTKLVRRKKKAISSETEKLQENYSITGKLNMENLVLMDRTHFWSEF